jgi:hypothetical protein
MKTLLSILAIVFAFAQPLPAQNIQTATFPIATGQPTRQQDITVAAGQVFRLLMWAPSNPGPNSLKVNDVSVQLVMPPEAPYNSSPLYSSPLYFPSFVVAGPCTVSLVVSSSASLVCSYILESNESIGTTVPSTAVVIPSDASGPVQIILESSTDLITWTAATPGSYGSSTAKRFFRVRAVAQ